MSTVLGLLYDKCEPFVLSCFDKFYPHSAGQMSQCKLLAFASSVLQLIYFITLSRSRRTNQRESAKGYHNTRNQALICTGLYK